MKEIIWKVVQWLLGAAFVVLVIADLGWLVKQSSPPKPPAWTIAQMRPRIQVGMEDEQVAAILGNPNDDEASPQAPGFDLMDGSWHGTYRYDGQDGSVWVQFYSPPGNRNTRVVGLYWGTSALHPRGLAQYPPLPLNHSAEEWSAKHSATQERVQHALMLPLPFSCPPGG